MYGFWIKKQIREEFVSFSKVPCITGECLFKEIQNILSSLNLLMRDVKGQGYDGASNMSSSTAGLQARVKDVSPRA